MPQCWCECRSSTNTLLAASYNAQACTHKHTHTWVAHAFEPGAASVAASGRCLLLSSSVQNSMHSSGTPARSSTGTRHTCRCEEGRKAKDKPPNPEIRCTSYLSKHIFVAWLQVLLCLPVVRRRDAAEAVLHHTKVTDRPSTPAFGIRAQWNYSTEMALGQAAFCLWLCHKGKIIGC